MRMRETMGWGQCRRCESQWAIGNSLFHTMVARRWWGLVRLCKFCNVRLDNGGGGCSKDNVLWLV